MKKTVILLLFLTATLQGFAQLSSIQFEQIDSLQKIQKRKIIVFIHTDWCKFCHAFKSQTLKNKDIIKKLNDNFYFIDFNAEEKRKIVFNNQTFYLKPTGTNSGIHELATELGTFKNQINYPTIAFLNDKNEIIFQHNGFLNTKDFKLYLDEIDE